MSRENASESRERAWPFTSVMEDALGRCKAFLEQAGEGQARAVRETEAAIDEGARLAKESLAYGLRVADDWRRFAAEALDRVAAAFAPRG